MADAADLDPACLTVIEALPAGWHQPEGGEEVFRRLRGAKLVQIGSPAEEGLEGGGLVIDYMISGAETPQRLVLAFNELGMWIQAEGRVAADPTPGATRSLLSAA